jgi:hypothetical protein
VSSRTTTPLPDGMPALRCAGESVLFKIAQRRG